MALFFRILLIISTVFVLYFFFLQMKLPSCFKVPSLPISLSKIKFKPTVKIYDLNPTDHHLHIVKSVFTNLGYHIVDINATNWDVLWSHPYPFYALYKDLANLRPHQKVNHFPGSGFLTQKANIISLDIKHIPKAFLMPEQKYMFITYSQQNKNRLWVQKSNAHRGIKVLDTQNVDLRNKGVFVQEFVDNPLLISGRKFDIGVYVVLTSVDPLRVYIFSGDILLRFCTEMYYPFNSSNVDSYVVGDDYLPVWEVPALRTFYTDLNYTAKESLNAYILSKKKNPKKLWSQISEVIHDMYQETENEMISATYKLGNLRNFFELIRVDFVVDEDLNVFLLEANMSPNLSAEHFPPNRLLYEQVFFDVLQIVGLVRRFPEDDLKRELEVSRKDITVFADSCNSQACNSSCKIQKCKVCSFCIGAELTNVAKTAYFEHMNRNRFRRVFPPPIDFKHSSMKASELSDMNSFMDRWFRGKCLQDSTFCQ